jgi:hypothetical protein
MIYPFTVGEYDPADPTTPRTPWDTVQLGQFILPGICTVHISRARKSTIKTPKGASYATIKDSGLELAKVNIINQIAFDSQLQQLQAILSYFDTQLGTKVTTKTGQSQTIPGFAVNHPALLARGINSLYIEDIEGPVVSRPGFITTTFKCVEVRNVRTERTAKVDPGKSFAQGSAFTPPAPPTPPSQNKATVAPKKR